ncbi:hypothetical protein D3273_27635 [Lichenibacterium minor]|uniref:Uncharacterized protein n=1 Tax=Lichenibacterium minor TaxID=2316528 RepID=A0A4Q2U265_9HYPH|nr:hypothetical protein [Lichenibacterium minor]RYC28756.1 hypothetical protein D3273_27635 [Lichenibacterium minor]
MHTTMPISDNLVGDLVRQIFGVEPAVMAALAHGDEQVRARFMPDAEPTTDPLDGLDVLVRRTVALAAALCDHSGAMSLVTEPQAAAPGWPSAMLANRCIVLGWALFIATQPISATPLLLEADEAAGGVMVPLISIDPTLSDLDDLLAELRRRRQLHLDDPDPAIVAHEDMRVVAHAGIVSVETLLTDWFGVDVAAIDLLVDWLGTRVAGSTARAVTAMRWLVNTAIGLAALIEQEAILAVRLKTERDARLAGDQTPTRRTACCSWLSRSATRGT